MPENIKVKTEKDYTIELVNAKVLEEREDGWLIYIPNPAEEVITNPNVFFFPRPEYSVGSEYGGKIEVRKRIEVIEEIKKKEK